MSNIRSLRRSFFLFAFLTEIIIFLLNIVLIIKNNSEKYKRNSVRVIIVFILNAHSFYVKRVLDSRCESTEFMAKSDHVYPKRAATH